MRSPPAIEQTKHPRSCMRSGARRFVAQAGSKPCLPQISSPQPHSAPFRFSPSSCLSRAHADLLCLLLLDCLLTACRAVDLLRLSQTSDRRVFLGAIHPIFLARARVRRFTEKAFTLHHRSQTSAVQPLIGEGFTPFFLHLYLHTRPLLAIALRPSPLYV